MQLDLQDNQSNSRISESQYWFIHDLKSSDNLYTLIFTIFFGSQNKSILIEFGVQNDRIGALLPGETSPVYTPSELANKIKQKLNIFRDIYDKSYVIYTHKIPELKDIHVDIRIMDFSALFQPSWFSVGDKTEQFDPYGNVCRIVGFRDNFAVYTYDGNRLLPTREQVKSMIKIPSFVGIRNMFTSKGFQYKGLYEI